MLSQLEYITTQDLLRDIVQQELGIKDDHIFMFGQPFLLPTYDDMFIKIQFDYSKVYSNRNLTPVNEGNISEEQNVNTQEYFVVQVFSKNWEAYRRKEEVACSFRSVYAQQSMEKYAYKLSVNPNIMNLTSLEASAMLYRFDIHVVVLTAYQFIKKVNYFDSFTVAVDVNTATTDIKLDFVQPTESLPT